jgi:hypothetical protein
MRTRHSRAMAEASGALNEIELRRVLRTAVADHDYRGPVELLAPVVADRDLSELTRRAGYHRVSASVFLSLHGLPGIRSGALGALKHTYLRGASRQLLTLNELEALAGRFAQVGLPWLLLKGAALAETIYQPPELRVYNDIDVLVAPGDLRGAVALLEEQGGQLLDRNWTLISREVRGQVHVLLASGSVVDLHWHVLNRDEVRSRFGVQTTTEMARARTVRIGASAIPTLAAGSTLVHICLHGALSGGDRLQWLQDIDRAVRHLGCSWDEVVERADEWRARLPVAVMLQRAARTLGTHVPSEASGAPLSCIVGQRPADFDRRWRTAGTGTARPSRPSCETATARRPGTVTSHWSRRRRIGNATRRRRLAAISRRRGCRPRPGRASDWVATCGGRSQRD